jgi:HEAT repeat protein
MNAANGVRVTVADQPPSAEALKLVLVPPDPFAAISDDAAYELRLRWKEPCEGAFEYLRKIYPDELFRWIRSNKLRPTDLTFAAEIAGRSVASEAVREHLLPLLRHPNRSVREGAVYGLREHMNEDVMKALQAVAEKDESAAVRGAAADALDDI